MKTFIKLTIVAVLICLSTPAHAWTEMHVTPDETVLLHKHIFVHKSPIYLGLYAFGKQYEGRKVTIKVVQIHPDGRSLGVVAQETIVLDGPPTKQYRIRGLTLSPSQRDPSYLAKRVAYTITITQPEGKKCVMKCFVNEGIGGSWPVGDMTTENTDSRDPRTTPYEGNKAASLAKGAIDLVK